MWKRYGEVPSPQQQGPPLEMVRLQTRMGERSLSASQWVDGDLASQHSQQMAVLEERKIIVPRREGQSIYYRIVSQR